MTRDRYLQRHLLANAALRFVDSLIDLVPSSPAPAIAAPRKLLLANAAHIGDVVITTSFLPALREAFPDCSIGFLTGSWSKDVVSHSPFVNQVHVLDHWRLNRARVSLRQKLASYASMRAAIVRELKMAQYDTAIDLYTCFPNFIPVLWQAGIPIRIGFVSSGFGGLLTHGKVFPSRTLQRERNFQADLLRLLPASPTIWDMPRNGLRSDQMLTPLADALPAGLTPRGFVVLHMGTGAPERRWPPAHWGQLARALQQSGLTIALTGAGAADRALVDGLKAEVAGCIDLCGKLPWPGFLSVVSQAALLVGVESMAGHVAAALGTPYTVIYAGITQHERWGPSGSGELLTRPVPCSPCFRRGGCAEMKCVREVTVEDVLRACRAGLDRK
jgi:ADP-heptose:LPS heptosyltransferase